MSHDADPWTDAFADKIIERLTAHFDTRHDEHARVHLELNRRLEAVEKRLDDLGLLGGEIQRGSTFTQMLAQDTWAKTHPDQAMPQPPRPLPQSPRPQAIDNACAVPPGEPAKVVRLPRYGATVVPEPDADPALVWSNFVGSINTPTEGGAARGLRGSRRT